MTIIYNVLLALFCFLFLLFLLFEEKNIFQTSIWSFTKRPITKVFLTLFLSFLFYLIHPFLALYLIGFCSCLPLIFDEKKPKIDVYFIHFLSYFIYRYFFFFGIFFVSLSSVFSIPAEAIIVNF